MFPVPQVIGTQNLTTGHEVHGCADHIIGILHPDHVGIRIHCILKNDHGVVMCMEDGSYRGVVWNVTNRRTGQPYLLTLEILGLGIQPFATRPNPP